MIMKKNKIIIFLLIVIVCLLSYIVYDKLKDFKKVTNKDEEVTLKNKIELDYVNFYLLSNGSAYIIPLNVEEINKLNVNNNLKDRLKTLYYRSFYYDIYVDNYKIKGFKISLDDEIRNIYRVENENNSYIVFVKENNTIGLFDYLDYYDNLNTLVIDNYNNIKDVLEIKNNKIVYLDGSSNLLIKE